MKIKRCKQAGFTMLELASVLLISSILASMGASFISNASHASKQSAIQEQFSSALRMARQYAISKGSNVSVCASSDGESCSIQSWSEGWIVYQGPRRNDGEHIDQQDIISGYKVKNDDLHLSVFNESLASIVDIRFNKQGFNVEDQILSAASCVTGDEFYTGSLIVERSGRVRVSTSLPTLAHDSSFSCNQA